MADRTAVYRFFDTSGALLYVGVSRSPLTRWNGHASEKAWWPQVAAKKLEWHPSRDDALLAEAIAIRDEKPAHNIARSDPDELAATIAELGAAREEARAEARVAPRCPCCGTVLPPLKVCANEACRKPFHTSAGGRDDAVFCSLACIEAQHERPQVTPLTGGQRA